MNTSVASSAVTPDPAQRERASRRATRWMTAIALLPAPLWLLSAVIRTPGPAWRAQYFGNSDFGGEPVVRAERALSVYWDDRNPTVAGTTIPGHDLSVRWDTCVRLEQAREIPFQLVSDAAARFSVDGQEKLKVEAGRNRTSRGEVLRLEAGVHQLLVEMSAPSWGGAALNASLDGRAPRALGVGATVTGVTLRHPRAGDPACE